MAGQETLIYIDENDEKNAGISAKKFTKEDLKNRAYYNILGANLVKKFLADKNIDVSDIYNIHNINKVLEELDISDIMLKNIHIDVRVIFNENYIFIPKSHFEYDILPDIYVVLQMSTDKKYTKFLGFFEPKLINKNNENEEYYFIEKEKLTSPENLKEFVQNFQGNTSEKLSDSETDESDMLILSLIDQDISEKDKKLLLKNLTKSAELRDRFIEFENFEMLSYRAEHSADLNINDSLNTDENMILSLDEAAEATAEVLKEYTKAHIVDQISKEEEIINGFNNLERNLPDFTPENADKTIDEYEKDFMNINIDELPFENNETIIDATEQNQVEISEISTSIDSDHTPEETEEIIDFESFENTTEFDKNEVTTQNEENTIIDLEELPIVETSNNISTTEIPQDIVNLDEIAPVNEEKKDFIDNSQDTVDLDEIETINQESPHHNIETEPETLNFEDIAPNIEEDLPKADIIITITTSVKPLFEHTMLNPNGVHINGAGSNALIRAEVPEKTIEAAEVLAVDSKDVAAIECGDILPSLEKGRLHWNEIVELGEITAGFRKGRITENGITIFQSQGMGLQDIMCAEFIYRKAVAENLGKMLPF